MISIIGAGPIGSFLGYKLSEKGIQNTIIEEHNEIGRPEQCTGLISRNIEDIIPSDSSSSWFKKAILNKVNGAVISCGKESFEVKTRDFKAYVFDRSRFDKVMAEKAKDKGSELLLGHKYLSHETHGKTLKIALKFGQNRKFLDSSMLVGADGPSSKVAMNSSLYGDRKFYTGIQYIVKIKKASGRNGGRGDFSNFSKDMVYLYLDSKYSEGFFAWVVPIDEERAKVGLASLSKPAERMDRFLKDKFDYFVVEEKQGGLIPIYKRMPLQNRQNNVFLVGGAALQCKATTGGGVINGMCAAKELAESIASGRFDYERMMGISRIRRNLWMHSMIRKRIDRMDDAKKEDLLRTLNDKKVKSVLEERGDMDFVARFGFKVLMAKPSLLKFVL